VEHAAPPPVERPAHRQDETTSLQAPPPDAAAAMERDAPKPRGAGRFPPADALAEWEAVLSALADARKVTLCGMYEQAKVMSWDRERIELGFSPDFEMAADKDNVEAMREFLRQHYGQPLALAVRILSADEVSSATPARSVVDMNRQRAFEDRRKREAEVHKHPIYNKVIEAFGAPVKEEINTNV
jgi:hypothetical protein